MSLVSPSLFAGRVGLVVTRQTWWGQPWFDSYGKSSGEGWRKENRGPAGGGQSLTHLPTLPLQESAPGILISTVEKKNYNLPPWQTRSEARGDILQEVLHESKSLVCAQASGSCFLRLVHENRLHPHSPVCQLRTLPQFPKTGCLRQLPHSALQQDWASLELGM